MNQVEAVLQALNIVIVNRKGRRAWALCPFHTDHSPTNFFIRISGSRSGQSHCFSCKRGGVLVDLVMHVRSCDAEAAKAFIDVLGKGYEPPKRRVKIIARPAQIWRSRFVMPPEIFFRPLEKWVTLARRYTIGRSITPEEVERYGIGYAVDGRLAGRIVIPWKGHDGLAAGYSARSFTGEEPKYLTPHETEKADLGVMFGEHTWSRTKETIVVTEGALNAMAVCRALPDHKFDIAAIGGSDINPMHIIKLGTFKRVVILTDSDPAGDKAAAALGARLSRHISTARVRLPEKKDAQDVGPEYLRDVLGKTFAAMGVTRVPFAS